MRKMIIGVVAACGFAATVVPALASGGCPYVPASSEKGSQQTASAQDTSTTSAR